MLRRKEARPGELKDAAEAVAADPTDATVRAQYAAALIRAGMFAQAAEELDLCLALCPPSSKKRLLVVVLRARLHNAIRRGKLWDQDPM